MATRGKRMISSLSERAKWELIGSSSANTGGHYELEAITQIKYTAGVNGAGIWRQKGGKGGEIQIEEAGKYNNVLPM